MAKNKGAAPAAAPNPSEIPSAVLASALRRAAAAGESRLGIPASYFTEAARRIASGARQVVYRQRYFVDGTVHVMRDDASAPHGKRLHVVKGGVFADQTDLTEAELLDLVNQGIVRPATSNELAVADDTEDYDDAWHDPLFDDTADDAPTEKPLAPAPSSSSAPPASTGDLAPDQL